MRRHDVGAAFIRVYRDHFPDRRSPDRRILAKVLDSPFVKAPTRSLLLCRLRQLTAHHEQTGSDEGPHLALGNEHIIIIIIIAVPPVSMPS